MVGRIFTVITIPDAVLETIVDDRPHLAGIVRNLRANPRRAAQFEKPLADAYLMGETKLSAVDTWKLSACCVGEKFGGGSRG
jgi:hypothetical protein